jgi:hypothetical protein
VRARGSACGVCATARSQELTAAAGPRPERNRTEEWQCCVVRAYQVKRLVRVHAVSGCRWMPIGCRSLQRSNGPDRRITLLACVLFGTPHRENNTRYALATGGQCPRTVAVLPSLPACAASAYRALVSLRLVMGSFSFRFHALGWSQCLKQRPTLLLFTTTTPYPCPVSAS